jgi:murein DD-endopeptidase MepM/ murein hydrolase activator NlpD
MMKRNRKKIKTKKERMISKITKTLLCQLAASGILLMPVETIQAEQIQSNEQTHPEEEETKPVVVVQSDKLVTDKVKMDNEHLVVDTMLMRIGLDSEEEMFPADELYDGEWDNIAVKAYRDITVPDTYSIDVSEFVMPIEGKVTSKYGKRRRRFHYGTDIKLQTGDTVRAAFDGKIRVKKYEKRGYGYYLVLRHSNGLETVYGHLSRFLVEEGENIAAGQPIALGGNTGRSTGAHLHFEFRFLGQAINPEEIIDFEQFCTKDEIYVYKKGISERSAPSSKYAAQGKGKIKYYRINKGDTLGSIARKTGISVDQLCKLNKIKASAILGVGKSIRLS